MIYSVFCRIHSAFGAIIIHFYGSFYTCTTARIFAKRYSLCECFFFDLHNLLSHSSWHHSGNIVVSHGNMCLGYQIEFTIGNNSSWFRILCEIQIGKKRLTHPIAIFFMCQCFWISMRTNTFLPARQKKTFFCAPDQFFACFFVCFFYTFGWNIKGKEHLFNTLFHFLKHFTQIVFTITRTPIYSFAICLWHFEPQCTQNFFRPIKLYSAIYL